MDALARQAGSISFPSDRMHKAPRYRRLESKLTQEPGRYPYPEELAPAMGHSARSIASLGVVIEAISSTRGQGLAYASGTH